MEGWSPRTLLRYGFCQEDEARNIVSMWNFAELDEALNRIESSKDEEVIPSPLSLTTTSSTLGSVGGLVPGNFAADSSFTAQDTLGGERVIDSSREGAVVHNDESRTATALSLTSTQPLGDCHHEPKWPIVCSELQTGIFKDSVRHVSSASGIIAGELTSSIATCRV